MIETIPLPAANLRDIAVLLDIDGTILDLAPTPGAVIVPQSLRQTLTRLSRATGRLRGCSAATPSRRTGAA